MTGSYLVDTDWAIHWPHNHQPIRNRLEMLRSQGLGIAVPSLAELWEGVHYSRNPAQAEHGLHDFLRRVSFVEMDEEACKIFGKLRGQLRKQGGLIDKFDLAIAATALRFGLTLLTNNRRHFENIEGLRMESLS